jgi:hypothetical protein
MTMAKPHPPPQLYAIRATAAPIAVVFAHRGPWFMIARWNLNANKVEPGTWFRGKIYQRRCDISPDGKFLYYFAMKGGQPFHAVSRVPWLTALALWRADSTYTNGSHFVSGRSKAAEWTPHQGTIAPLRKKHGLALASNETRAYAAERLRGWREHPEAAPRPRSDVFHENTPQWLVADQPGGESRLELRDEGYVRGRLEGRNPCYSLDGEPLVDVSWADWDRRGRLLIATRRGTLEIRNANNNIQHSCSLAQFVPDPRPSPAHAQRW